MAVNRSRPKSPAKAITIFFMELFSNLCLSQADQNARVIHVRGVNHKVTAISCRDTVGHILNVIESKGTVAINTVRESTTLERVGV